MLHRLIIAAPLIFLLGSSAISQPASPSVTKMGNGLTVILQEDHVTDLVGVDVWVKAGSGYETAQNSGVSHFIEHLLFGTTKKRQPGDMDREMESVGATLDAHTNRDYVHFSTTVSSRYLPKALDIFADAVMNSQFREADIERERPVILDEIAKKLNNPTKICQDLLAKELYGPHPYALPIEGTPQSVKNMSRQDILDYYHRYYVPSNIAVVLVGDIDSQTAISEIGKAFQDLTGSQPALTARPEIPVHTTQLNKPIKIPFERGYLAIGFIGPKGSDFEGVCATDVLLTYLGLGYRSWMADELRRKLGLAQEATADFLTERDPGVISIVAATTTANLSKARGAIFAKLATLTSAGLTPGEIELAKRSLLGQAAFQGETFGGRASTYGFYFAASDPGFAARYVDCVQSVTNDSIMRVAKKYLNPDTAVVLTVGPDQGDPQ